MNWQINEDELENPNCEKNNNNDCKCYDCNIMNYIKSVYLIGLILWFLLILLLNLMEPDIIVWIFLFLPPAVYLINLINIQECSKQVEREMFKGNFLSFGFLITIILLNWNSPLENQDKSKFFRLLVVAFILIMVSLVDIWVSHKNQSIVKHIKTVLHTAALSLMALALYLYYQFYSKSCAACI